MGYANLYGINKQLDADLDSSEWFVRTVYEISTIILVVIVGNAITSYIFG